MPNGNIKNKHSLFVLPHERLNIEFTRKPKNSVKNNS